ncbi:hypothetical protein ACEQ8H_001853 [Pleosporales sp. CAS-2024a]
MHQVVGREGAGSPAPTHFSPQQMKSYLQDLRTNRPARPTGARPAPAHFNTWSSRSRSRLSEIPAVTPLQRTCTDPVTDVDARPSSSHEPRSHSRRTSNMSIDEIIKGPGRALVQPPRGRDMSTSTSHSRTPSVQYRESEQRQSEQEEARAVRIAMEELDMAQEERLFEAARDEAAELVYKHRNPDAPVKGPTTPYPYPGLTRKGSTQRSKSVDLREQDLQRENSKLRKRHSMGSATSGSRSSSLQSNRGTGSESPGLNNSPTKEDFDAKDKPVESSSFRKAISDLPSFGSRRKSSGSRRRISGSLFSNPNDHIYEEPEEEAPPAPAPTPAAAEPPKSEKLPLGIRRNPFMRFQSVKGNPTVRSNTDPVLGNKKFDRYEIQKNPPTQSRNAVYTLNPSTTKAAEPAKSDAENEPEIKMKDGKEIRSDDLRAATGFRLRDRSPKLPTPTMVSDSPGRPIVSFQKGYNEIELKEDVYGSIAPITSSSAPGLRPLSNAVTSPAVPTMHTIEGETKKTITPPSVPQINVSPTPAAPASRFNRAGKPTINVYEDPPVSSLSSAASRKVNVPAPAAPASARPAINVYQAPAARSQPVSAPSVPTISVSSSSSMSTSRPANTRGHTANVPSIGVTQPIPSISVSDSPAASGRRSFGTPSTGVTPPVPSISVSESPAPSRGRGGSVPLISVTPEIPTISVNEPSAPARAPKINVPSMSVGPTAPCINVNGPSGSTRPLPDPKHHSSRPFGRGGAAVNARPHWTPTNVRTGALCTQCALPIAGRIVSAAGLRFHPECFVCYQCGEALECVAFYPEPENKLAERIARIHARQRGEDIAFLATHPTGEDMARLAHQDGTDECQRFFCHLDFHEMFSPRCKSCKTPIEGEVIVACGAEWHAGHFFCAQCGDPFDSSTPFVEKDGNALGRFRMDDTSFAAILRIRCV